MKVEGGGGERKEKSDSKVGRAMDVCFLFPFCTPSLLYFHTSSHTVHAPVVVASAAVHHGRGGPRAV